MLINLEPVGEMDEYEGGGMFGSYREEGFDFYGSSRGGQQFARDVLFLGEADKGIKEFADALGWADELQSLYDEGHAALAKQGLGTKDMADPEVGTTEEKAEAVAEAVAKAVESRGTAATSDAATTPDLAATATPADDLTDKLAGIIIADKSVADTPEKSHTVSPTAETEQTSEAPAPGTSPSKTQEPHARDKTAAL